MQKTTNLKLPIYDTPNVDTFNLADWNTANQNLEEQWVKINDQYNTIVNIENVGVPVEVSNLSSKIDEFQAYLGYMPINGGIYDGNDEINLSLDGGSF